MGEVSLNRYNTKRDATEPGDMKITVQEKIAELERRIVDVERRLSASVTRTTTTTTGPITASEERNLARIWASFDAVFAEFGKIWR